MSKRLVPSTIVRRSAALAVLPAVLALGASAAHASFPGASGKIAFVTNKDGNDEIYAVNADGSDPVDLSNNPASDIDPAWAPGGGKIVFSSDRFPSWSPDSSHIAFVSDRDGNEEIYVMGADGQNQTRLTTSSRSDRYPVFSPDGRQIMFRSALLGQRAIFVMNADGTGATQI